jgi:hypothetical protein
MRFLLIGLFLAVFMAVAVSAESANITVIDVEADNLTYTFECRTEGFVAETFDWEFAQDNRTLAIFDVLYNTTNYTFNHTGLARAACTAWDVETGLSFISNIFIINGTYMNVDENGTIVNMTNTTTPPTNTTTNNTNTTTPPTNTTTNNTNTTTPPTNTTGNNTNTTSPPSNATTVDVDTVDFRGCGQVRIVFDDFGTGDSAFVSVNTTSGVQNVAVDEEDTATIRGQYGNNPLFRFTSDMAGSSDAKILAVTVDGQTYTNQNNCATS